MFCGCWVPLNTTIVAFIILLAFYVAVIENKWVFKHQDLKMFGLKLNKYK